MVTWQQSRQMKRVTSAHAHTRHVYSTAAFNDGAERPWKAARYATNLDMWTCVPTQHTCYILHRVCLRRGALRF